MLDDLADARRDQAAQDAAFDPPYTTIHVGSLHGGTALNFVPDRAVLEFEIRDIPGADVSTLLVAAIDDADRGRDATTQAAGAGSRHRGRRRFRPIPRS